jgi:hypothetical protein
MAQPLFYPYFDNFAYVLEELASIFAYVLEEKQLKFAYVLEKYTIFVVEIQKVQYDTTKTSHKPTPMGCKEEPQTTGYSRGSASWQNNSC